MKKRLLLVAAAMLMIGAANAQRPVAKTKGSFSPCVGQFTKSGKGVILAEDEDVVTVYNSQMNVEKTFTPSLQKHTYKTWTEEATFRPTGFSYAFYSPTRDDAGTRVEGFSGNPFPAFEGIDFSDVKTAEQLVQKLQSVGLLDDDAFAFTDFKGNPAFMYYFSDYNFKYPKALGYRYPANDFYALIDGKVHRIYMWEGNYGEVIGDNVMWNIMSETIETHDADDYVEDDIELYDMDNAAEWEDWEMGYTQTLFNDDDKWEFIVRQIKIVDIPGEYKYIRREEVFDNGMVYIERRGGQADETDKYVIMNEDGNVCYTLDMCPEEIYRIGGKNYIMGEIEENGEYWDVLYELEKGTANVREVTRVKGSHVTDEEGALMVEVDESMAGSDVFVSNAAGQIVGRGHVKKGESNARIAMPTRTPGVYVVSLKRDGRTVDSHKMILK